MVIRHDDISCILDSVFFPIKDAHGNSLMAFKQSTAVADSSKLKFRLRSEKILDNQASCENGRGFNGDPAAYVPSNKVLLCDS